MGAANVIPGVSGGTVAFITGIYEELINAIKSFDLRALRLALRFNVRELSTHVNLPFLIPVFVGVAISIVSLAKLLEYVFCTYESLTLAFFFGLILASVYLVGKQVHQWNTATILMLLLGSAIAVSLSFFNPAGRNENLFYVFLCGIVAISSMILPGLSGSYVLLIMGNYLLILSAITELRFDLLIPFALGCGFGLILFSHLLAFIFEKFRDGTIALLTGFVLGSLVIIWPWKETRFLKNKAGEYINKSQEVITDVCREGVMLAYDRFLPEVNTQFFIAFLLIIIGGAIVVGIERLGADQSK